MPGYTKGNWPPLSESQKVKEIFNAYDPLLPQPPRHDRDLSDMKKLEENILSPVHILCFFELLALIFNDPNENSYSI